MKQTKRILSVVLCLLMLVAVVPVMEAGALSINDASVFLHQPTDGDSTCVFTSCLNMFRRRAIIDGDSGWDTITHSNYKSAITTNGVSVRFTITDVRGMNAAMTTSLTSDKKSYFISMLNEHPEGIVIYCGSSPMHTVLLTDYDHATDTFYCAETLSSFGYGRIPLTSCYLSTNNGGLSQNGVISKISQVWYITNRSGGFDPATPAYANLGDDFWAYLGNQGCGKWIAGQGVNVQGESCTGDINQMWHFIRQSNGSYCILCLSNSYAMDIENGLSDAGANLKLMPYVANAEQQFFIYYKDGAYYFKSSYADLWIDMDQSSYNIAMWNAAENYSPQKFNIQKIDYYGSLPQNLGTNFYAIIKNEAANKWITDQNFNVQGDNPTSSYNQMWYFIRHDDGSYSFLCNNSYAMEVANESSRAGANLQMASYTANAAQRFYIYYRDGAYYIKSSYADLWIDMDQSSFNVAMWSAAENYSPQKFNIQRIDSYGNLPQNLGNDFYAIIKNETARKWITDRNYNVQGENPACASNQIWHFIRHDDGSYSFLCNSSYAMEVTNDSSNAGTNLQMASYTASTAQRFYIYYRDEAFYIKSVYADLWIDMDQSNYNVAMWNQAENYPSQEFEIISVNSNYSHTWNSGAVTKAATCVATGTKTYTCTVCNAAKTETIAINSSNHVNKTNVAATASTCAVKGYTAGVYCNDCKKYISGHAEQPLAAHKTTTQNAKAATCTAEGYTGDQVCTVCKQTITKGTAIAKKAHTLTTVNQKAATCTAEGYTGDQVCTVCKQTITKGTAIAKKAHTLTTVNQKAAGCTTAGYTGDQYCTTCKQTITKGSAVNALGHTSPDSNGNCTRCGTHIKDVAPAQPSNPQPNPNTCKYCGQVHSGPFGWLIKFFHSILAIFKR